MPSLKKKIFGYQNFWLATKFLELVANWRPEIKLTSMVTNVTYAHPTMIHPPP
jgi:hypothetical protein